MIECCCCGSIVRHEHAQHECVRLDDGNKFRCRHPWFGAYLDKATGKLVPVHEDTHFQLADGSYIRKDEI